MSICSVEGCRERARTLGFCNKHALRWKRTGTTAPGPRGTGTLEERFWRKVDKGEECWLWTGNKRPNGYGAIQEGGKGTRTLSAHRLSFEMHSGPIPDGMVVMHTCDNPTCVNPAHLELGTYQDNMDDMWAKGRGRPAINRGESSGKAKLTEELVRYIRANPERGHKDLADELGLKPNTVRGVRIGRTWRHVE